MTLTRNFLEDNKGKIPYDVDGNLHHGIYRWMSPEEILWKENTEWGDTLEYIRCEYNNSTVTMVFRSIATKCVYPMTFSHFEELFRDKKFDMFPLSNVISGTFKVIKHGQMYNIYLVKK